MTLVCIGMASCAGNPTTVAKKGKSKSKEYFAESEYGVKASPRVIADGQPVPRGGGRFLVGDPYEVKGKTYVPKEDPNYNKSGLASWYGSAFHGRMTANGEVYDSDYISAAHPTFPLPSYARVTNLDTGSSVIVRVNDRGPFHPGRVIDVSEKTAELLDFRRTGTARVNVQYVGRARMDGRDMPFLMASYVRKGERVPGVINPEGQIASGVMVASNRSLGDDLQSYGSRTSSQTAFAGSTPQGKPAKVKPLSASFEEAVRSYDAPQAKPAPAARPAPAVAQRQPVQPQPVVRQAALPQPVAVQRKPAPVVQPAVPVMRQAQMAAPVQAAPAHRAEPSRIEAPKVAPAKARPAMETASAAPAPSAKTPRVMFGNVVLREDGVLETDGGGAAPKAARR
ncbi:rare lipoprotein A [Rhizobium sp. RU35A]|nr:rare lipoprotein A [Rhizobium sp. RU35A]